MKKILLALVLLILVVCIASCDVDTYKTQDAEANPIPANNLPAIELASTQGDHAQMQRLAAKLKVNYEIINNVSAKECANKVKSGSCFEAKIKLQIDEPIGLENWRIYFSHMSPIIQENSELFDITHVNGDQHYISPTTKFTGWQKNKAYDINLKAEFWHISEFDSPPNFYLFVDGQPPQVIQSTRAKIDPDTGLEFIPHMTPIVDPVAQFKRGKEDLSKWATAEVLFEDNIAQIRSDVNIEHHIIPTPLQLIRDNFEDYLAIEKGFKLVARQFKFDSKNPAIQRLIDLGITFDDQQGIPLIIESLAIEQLTEQQRQLFDLPKQTELVKMSQTERELLESGYLLTVSEHQIVLKAFTPVGAFYGLQSIASLYQPKLQKFPLIQVLDRPRYAYRGFFLDVARNFRDKDFVIKLLDQMAAYKLNKFHFHLGDDEGWRLQIQGLPELTQLGANRCHDPKEQKCLSPQLGSGPFANGQNDGYYTAQDYQQIISEAAARHIEIIPSFDMPGHSRAAVKSMQLRYQNYMKQGESELAKEFLLTDLNDQTEYRSVQFYNDNTINVCKDSTYRFVEKVLTEVIGYHQQAHQPLTTYHIGADETAGAWKKSPECAEFIKKNNLTFDQLTGYFIQRVANFLAAKNIRIGGWSDGLSSVEPSNMPEQVHVNVWTPLFWEGHKVANSMVNKDWQVVLSVPDVTYFDFPYQADPKERGYYWGARYTNTRQIFQWMPDNLPIHAEFWKDRLNRPYAADDRPSDAIGEKKPYQPRQKSKSYYGVQAQLWSEMVRSDDIAEYMIFPRLIALAERAWHKPGWAVPYDHQGKLFTQDSNYFTQAQRKKMADSWSIFSQVLAEKELIKLDRLGIKYRLPTAGAKLVGNKLYMNSTFQGLPLQFKVGDGPWQAFEKFDEGEIVDHQQPILVRTTNPSGNRFSRSLRLNQTLTLSTQQ